MSTTPRRVVVSEYVSLDGVMEDPSWTAPYWNDEIAAFKGEEDSAAESLLLGRVTYEMFAAAWPTSEDPSAARINALHKYVASTTLRQEDLDETGWNATLLEGDAMEAVRALRQTPGGDLLVWGSGALARALMAHGLVDEYRLIVYPVVLGSGKRLFGAETATLDLVETRPFATGATGLVYRPAA
ncbi:MAG TPA: dihydrofolate reductase [Bacteroidetes bacterium]|nr:dihydrofolate reductase [Bacteroidota bacterium]